MGGVVPVYHLPGIKAGAIKFTGPLLADDLHGQGQEVERPGDHQDQPRRQASRPRDHASIHRSDGSGTTYIFTNYLSKVSAAWKEERRQREGGLLAGRHRRQGQRRRRRLRPEGRRLDRLRRIRLRAAEQADLWSAAQQGGPLRRPDRGGVQAAAASADWKAKPGFGIMLTDQPGAKAWPISGATFILMYKKQAHPERALAGAQVLQLELPERRQARHGPRLRADAGLGGQADPGLLGAPTSRT